MKLRALPHQLRRWWLARAPRVKRPAWLHAPNLPPYIPIAQKLAFAISAISLVGMVGVGLVVNHNQSRLFDEQMSRLGSTVVRQLAESAKEPILADDPLLLGVMVRNLASVEGIIGISVFSYGGTPLATEGIQPFAIDPQLQRQSKTLFGGEPHQLLWRHQASDDGVLNTTLLISPIRFQDVLAGHAVLVFDRTPLDQARRRALWGIAIAALLMIVVGTWVAIYMGRRFSRPIHHLMDASRAIGAGHYHFRLPERRRQDEIGELVTSFNHMADGLLQKRQVESALSRYVSSSVAKNIMANLRNLELGGHHVEGTVVFADIVGFTSLSERLPPAEIGQLLNLYFTLIGQAANLNQGVVDKYIGDCAMLVFGVPEADPAHALHAAQTALLIQAAVGELNQRRRARGEVGLEFHIGINTGVMLAGNLGSAERMQYTVVGDSVNLASRLCSYAEADGIIVSHEMAQTPGVAERYRLQQHQSIHLRGKQEPVFIYRLQGMQTAFQTQLDRQVERLMGEIPL